MVEQIVRPTGLVDPEVVVRPTKGQIDDLIEMVNDRVVKGDRILVTTLTKKMAEDLTEYLLEQGLRVRYLHSNIDTIQRIEILRALRLGEFESRRAPAQPVAPRPAEPMRPSAPPKVLPAADAKATAPKPVPAALDVGQVVSSPLDVDDPSASHAAYTRLMPTGDRLVVDHLAAAQPLGAGHAGALSAGTAAWRANALTLATMPVKPIDLPTDRSRPKMS